MKPEYKAYWLISAPHCKEARQVKQVDGKVAYVCEHPCIQAKHKLRRPNGQ